MVFLICGTLKMHVAPHMLPRLIILVGTFVLYILQRSLRSLTEAGKLVAEVAQSQKSVHTQNGFMWGKKDCLKQISHGCNKVCVKCG